MIITSLGLKEELKEYASPKSKLTRMIKSEELIQIKRGLYIPGNEQNYSLKAISGILYGPSYVSFESALSYYGLIPEQVKTITCASYGKNKNKIFNTPIGAFHYYHVPEKAYPLEVIVTSEGDYSFLIATPEKAVLDKLSRIKNADVKFHELLESDLRVDMDRVASLNSQTLVTLAKLYRKRICIKFAEWHLKEFIYA